MKNTRTCPTCNTPIAAHGDWSETLIDLTPPLNQHGELTALLQGLKTFTRIERHKGPPQYIHRTTWRINRHPTELFWPILREHRCNNPPVQPAHIDTRELQRELDNLITQATNTPPF